MLFLFEAVTDWHSEIWNHGFDINCNIKLYSGIFILFLWKHRPFGFCFRFTQRFRKNLTDSEGVVQLLLLKRFNKGGPA